MVTFPTFCCTRSAMVSYNFKRLYKLELFWNVMLDDFFLMTMTPRISTWGGDPSLPTETLMLYVTRYSVAWFWLTVESVRWRFWLTVSRCCLSWRSTCSTAGSRCVKRENAETFDELNWGECFPFLFQQSLNDRPICPSSSLIPFRIIIKALNIFAGKISQVKKSKWPS